MTTDSLTTYLFASTFTVVTRRDLSLPTIKAIHCNVRNAYDDEWMHLCLWSISIYV